MKLIDNFVVTLFPSLPRVMAAHCCLEVSKQLERTYSDLARQPCEPGSEACHHRAEVVIATEVGFQAVEAMLNVIYSNNSDKQESDSDKVRAVLDKCANVLRKLAGDCLRLASTDTIFLLPAECAFSLGTLAQDGNAV